MPLSGLVDKHLRNSSTKMTSKSMQTRNELKNEKIPCSRFSISVAPKLHVQECLSIYLRCDNICSIAAPNAQKVTTTMICCPVHDSLPLITISNLAYKYFVNSFIEMVFKKNESFLFAKLQCSATGKHSI